MTSGAIQQGVPTNVLRALGWWPHDALRSMLAATPKSASSTVPSVSTKMLPACKEHPVSNLSAPWTAVYLQPELKRRQTVVVLLQRLLPADSAPRFIN